MATTESATNDSSNDESSTANDYPFSGVLSERGVEEMDIVHRHMGGLVDEYRLEITDDGWTIRVVDPSNVAMLDVHIPTTVFSEYERSEDIEVGLNADQFNDAIQDSDGTLSYTGRNVDEPRWIVEDTEVLAIDPDSVRMSPDIPELDLPTRAVIEDIELFNHFCSETIDAIQVSGSSEGIALHSDGDVSSATLLLPDGNGSDVRASTNNGSTTKSLHDRVKDMHSNDRYRGSNEVDRSLFSRDYLENAFKKLLVRHKRGVSYELEMGTEFPLKLHRRDDNSEVSITFMLAPRIGST